MPIETISEREVFACSLSIARERRDFNKRPLCHFDSIMRRYPGVNFEKSRVEVLNAIWKKLDIDGAMARLKKDPKKENQEKVFLIGEAVSETVKDFSFKKLKSKPKASINEKIPYQEVEFIISQVEDGQPLKELMPLITEYRLFKAKKEIKEKKEKLTAAVDSKVSNQKPLSLQ